MPKSDPYCKVGPYLVMETVNNGSFGKVRECLHHGEWKRFACKVIERSVIHDRDLSLQVQKEIAIMRHLQHKNVVALNSVHSTPTKVFIVMELVQGGELFDEIIKCRRMSEPYARFYFRQLIEGLQYCHAHGVHHRDLKPENILLDDTGVLKITDFGLASIKSEPDEYKTELTNRSFLLHTQCGTPNYVAPEIINLGSDGYSGSKVDAWACGVILYVLVAGSLPFDAWKLPDLFHYIVHCDLKYPPFFSEDLKDLIGRLLNLNPADRYSLADVEKHPWYNGPVETVNDDDAIQASLREAISGPIPNFTADLSQEKEGIKRRHSTSDVHAFKKEKLRHQRGIKGFGSKMRVSSCSSGLTKSSLPKQLYSLRLAGLLPRHSDRASKYHSGSGHYSSAEDSKTVHEKQMGLEPSAGPFFDLRNEVKDLKSRSLYEMASFKSRNNWVLEDSDRMMWCRMMKDFDMKPDVAEFDLDSATLSGMWTDGLAKEHLAKNNSFALDGLEISKRTHSRSAQCLSSASPVSQTQSEAEVEAEAWLAASIDTSYPRTGNLKQSEAGENLHSVHSSRWEDMNKFMRESMSAANSSQSYASSFSECKRSSALTPRGCGEAGCHDEQISREAENAKKIASTESVEEGPPARCSSFSHHDIADDSKRGSAVQNMGQGRDLLDESELSIVDVQAKDNGLQNQSQSAGFSLSERQTPDDKLRQYGSHGTKATTSVTSIPTARTYSTPGDIGNDGGSEALSPFALDVPGPRRALPPAKTFLGSLIPSTISPRRLLRKPTSPPNVKSFTQFHSLQEPSACFAVLRNVLREYGCSIFKATPSRSRQRFQIRCEYVKERIKIYARIDICRIDEVLCSVVFKRLRRTDVEDFVSFYSDISGLYSKSHGSPGP